MSTNRPDPYQQEYDQWKAAGFPPQQTRPAAAERPAYQNPGEAYQAGQRDMRTKLTTPRMTGYRIACGCCWAFWTILLVIAAFASFASGSAAGIFALALAGLTGWYDFRIWTLKARYLTIMFII